MDESNLFVLRLALQSSEAEQEVKSMIPRFLS